MVEAGPLRYVWAKFRGGAGPPRAGAVEAIPGPIDRLLDVAPGRCRGAGMGREDAGPADVEAGGRLAAAFFSAA